MPDKEADVPRTWIVVAACAVLVSGCAKVDQPKQPKLVPVEGQVFIVTRGQVNLKLALVQVSALPESTVLAHIDSCIAQIQAGKERMEADRSASRLAAEAAIPAAVDRAARANAEYGAVIRSVQGYRNPTDELKLGRAREAAAQADAAVSALRARVKLNSEPMYVIGTSARDYFDGLPTSDVVAKTDADGEFTLSLPAGQRFALAAQASRETVGNTESYYWMVWVVPRDGAENRVMLSNDNMITSDSPESAVRGNVN